VEVDGRRYLPDGNTVSVRDIRPGYHTVRVYREVRKNRGGWWNFGNGNSRQETIYNSTVNLKNGYHFDIVINRFGKVLVDEHRMDRNGDWYNEDDDYYNGGRGRNRDQDNHHDNRYDNNSRAMSDYDFNQAKETIRQVWFENTRINTARQIIDGNYFNARQVKEILLLFTFENNRLDLAKYAYGNTVDKGNYFVVNEVFTFNNNKEELARYIRDYR
jgi:hypothetical protein